MRAPVRPSVTFLVNVFPPKPLDVATLTLHLNMSQDVEGILSMTTYYKHLRLNVNDSMYFLVNASPKPLDILTASNCSYIEVT